MQLSARAVFVTPSARGLYAERYNTMPAGHWAVIPNGYSEEDFAEVERNVTRPLLNGRPLHLLHSGILYPTPDRDPTAFFVALSRLRAAGQIGPSQLRVTLRASGFDERYRAQIHQHGLSDIVELAPPAPYREALAEMLTADGLLLFQGYTSNPAIPAKLYEYLRAKRPIFALVDSEGDTAATLRAASVGTMVPLESSEEIGDGLKLFLESVRAGTSSIASDTIVRSHARESHTAALAELLNEAAHDLGPKAGTQS
jgi:glycosyltransferase involved in cell wall biosynthesis